MLNERTQPSDTLTGFTVRPFNSKLIHCCLCFHSLCSLSACSLVPFTNICSQRRLTVQTFQHLQRPVDKMWSRALKGALLAEEMLKRTLYGVFFGGRGGGQDNVKGFHSPYFSSFMTNTLTFHQSIDTMWTTIQLAIYLCICEIE